MGVYAPNLTVSCQHRVSVYFFWSDSCFVQVTYSATIDIVISGSEHRHHGPTFLADKKEHRACRVAGGSDKGEKYCTSTHARMSGEYPMAGDPSRRWIPTRRKTVQVRRIVSSPVCLLMGREKEFEDKLLGDRLCSAEKYSVGKLGTVCTRAVCDSGPKVMCWRLISSANKASTTSCTARVVQSQSRTFDVIIKKSHTLHAICGLIGMHSLIISLINTSLGSPLARSTNCINDVLNAGRRKSRNVV